jgi:hypothetical protein
MVTNAAKGRSSAVCGTLGSWAHSASGVKVSGGTKCVEVIVSFPSAPTRATSHVPGVRPRGRRCPNVDSTKRGSVRSMATNHVRVVATNSVPSVRRLARQRGDGIASEAANPRLDIVKLNHGPLLTHRDVSPLQSSGNSWFWTARHTSKEVYIVEGRLDTGKPTKLTGTNPVRKPNAAVPDERRELTFDRCSPEAMARGSGSP